MKKIILTVLFFNTITSITSQNTTFDNVSIGVNAPTYGIKIKPNFPNVNGSWARGFYVTNENGNQNYISLGTYGNVANGITSIINSYIGPDYDNRYMTFTPNGNIGIGTTTPFYKLDVIGGIGIGSESVNANTTKLFLKNPAGKTWAISSGANMVTESSFSIYNWTDNQTSPFFHIAANGNIGIGTVIPDTKLAVNGTIHTKEVKVDIQSPMTVPDYVFADDYKLKSLQEIEDYIKEHKHLPEIPSAKEIEKNGLMLAEMNMALLKKMEEMTLYMIEQNKQIKNLEKKIDTLTNKQ